MENQKQVIEKINASTPEILRLECYKMVEDYVLPGRFDRKEEVTEEQMMSIFKKAELLYQYISGGLVVSDHNNSQKTEDNGITKSTRSAYYRWISINSCACRKPIDVIKNKLTVPEDFVFTVQSVEISPDDNNIIHLVLSVKVILDDCSRNDRYVHVYKKAEELELDYYDCEGMEPSIVRETKSDTPKVFSDGRKVYPSKFEVVI